MVLGDFVNEMEHFVAELKQWNELRELELELNGQVVEFDRIGVEWPEDENQSGKLQVWMRTRSVPTQLSVVMEKLKSAVENSSLKQKDYEDDGILEWWDQVVDSTRDE